LASGSNPSDASASSSSRSTFTTWCSGPHAARDGRHLFDCLLSVVQTREFMVENMKVVAKPAGDVQIEA
jgi:hypothetical protein